MTKKQLMYPYVEQWFNSSEKKKDYCARHNLSPYSLDYWITKYRKEKISNTESSDGKFVPIEIEESHSRVSSCSARVEIELPYGVKLKIY